jgi:hypothetical protein
MTANTRADTGAAVAEVAGRPFQHQRVPSDAAQEVGGKQAANRTADDQCARPGQRSLHHSCRA